MGYCVGCVLMAIMEVPDERGSVMSYDAMEPTWQDKYNAVSDARYSLCEGYAVSDRVAVRDVCLASYAGYGACVRSAGHEGTHRDAFGYEFVSGVREDK